MTTEPPAPGDSADPVLDDLMARLRDLPSRVGDSLGELGEVTGEHTVTPASLEAVADVAPPAVEPTPAAPIPVVRIDDFGDVDAPEPVVVAEPGAGPVVAPPGTPGAPRRPGIDPRIRARRIEVARAQGRRRLRVLVALVVVAVLAVGTVVVLHSALFAVSDVQVNGAVYTDQLDIDAAVRAVKGQPILSADLGKARKILEASPWVKRAAVTREWPHSVRIDVVERVPAASYPADDGQWRVIDPTGRVLAALDGQPRDLVPVIGPQDAVPPGGTAPAKLIDGAQVVNALPPSIKPLVESLKLDGDGGVGLVLVLRTKAKGQIVIGNSDVLKDKYEAVLAVFHRLDAQKVEVLDVRVPQKVRCLPATVCQSLTGGTS
jgi:cell division protein FtsQ